MANLFDARNVFPKENDGKVFFVVSHFDVLGNEAKDTWFEVVHEWHWTTHMVLETELSDGRILRPGGNVKLAWFELTCRSEAEADELRAKLTKRLVNSSADLDSIRLCMQDWLSSWQHGPSVPRPVVKCFVQGPSDKVAHELN